MLSKEIQEWKSWAVDADRNEDGWESDYSRWEKMIESAFHLLLKKNLSNIDLESLMFMFEISNETEDLISFSVNNFKQCKQTLIALIESESPEVRWQIYEIFKYGDAETDKVLEKALDVEDDNYALRRAILSLCERSILNKEKLAEPFLSHSDPYIQKAAMMLVDSSEK